MHCMKWIGPIISANCTKKNKQPHKNSDYIITSAFHIQIKITMSKDKLRILIKILAESHMAFDLGDKIDIRYTDRQTSPTPFPDRVAGLMHGHEEEEME